MITGFYVYDDATGEIVLTGICDESHLPGKAGVGQTVVQTEANLPMHGYRHDLTLGEAVPVDEPEPSVSIPPLTEEQRVEQIKRLANQAILQVAPEWKQRNMLARSVELADKKAGGPLTPDEIAEENAMQAVWSQIKEIRRTSDLAEAAGTAPTDVVWPT